MNPTRLQAAARRNVPAFALIAALASAQAAVNVKVNFQPDASALPAGFSKDIGLPFDASRGFGWVTEASLASPTHVPLDLRPNSRDRARTGIAPELNTLIQFQDQIVQTPRVNARGAWEYSVPTGTYKVVVSVGDSYYDSHHYIRVEGALVIGDFVGSAAQQFKRDSLYVNVTDGRVTVDGVGGSNSKLNYVRIESQENPGEAGEIRIRNLDGVPFDDRLVFSRINTGVSTHLFHDVAVLRVHNDGPGDLELQGLAFTVAGKWTFPNNDQALLPISIAPGGFRDLPIRFIETAGSKGIRQGELVLTSDDSDERETRIQLAGAFMTAPEGGNEVFNPAILAAYGYQVRMLGAGQTLAMPNLYAGEEVNSVNWRRARSHLPVTVRQLTAFHGCCSDQVLFELLGTGGGSFRHKAEYGQSFLPLLAGTSGQPAGITLNPTGNLTFRIAGYTVAANSLGNRGVRIWPLRDRSGRLVPDAYFVIQDYVNGGASANLDFNDNLYLVTNIQPIAPAQNPSIPGLYPGAPGLSLEFDQAYPGTLPDKDGLTTGFAGTIRNKLDRTNVTDSYQPGRLDMDLVQGTLTVGTTSGVNRGSTNTQVNSLALPFDGRHSRFSVRTVLNGPLTGLNALDRQAGAVLGADQDNFVQVSAGVFAAGGAFSVRFTKEFAGTAATLATVAVGNPADLLSLELVLFGNPITGVVTAAYRAVFTGSQTGYIALPGQAAVTGVDYHSLFDRRSWAGLMTSHGASTATSVAFDRFAVKAEAGNGSGPIRLINVGGPSYTAQDGRVWASDAGLFSPSTAPAENGGSPAPAIANTLDDVLYQTYRGNVGGGTPQADRVLTFDIPVGSPRAVLVKLHFAELYHGAPGKGPAGPGKRVFDVSAEGRTVLEDFDLTAAAGSAVTAVTVPIENIQVNDGNLTLAFQAEIDFAAISAIEVLQH